MKKFSLILVLILIFGCKKEVIKAQTFTQEPSKKEMAYMCREGIFEEKDFSEEALINLIEELNLQHPEIVYAQAKLESGNFTSRLFKKHNNLFGMTVAAKRPTLAVKNSNTVYASYKSWKYSVIDYALYQSSYMRNLSKEAYYKKLLIYAEDSSYVSKLKTIAKEYVSKN